MKEKEVIPQEQANQIETLAVPTVFNGELPDLSKATAASLELTGEYWTPVAAGEVRRMYFNELRMEMAVDVASGKEVELMVAYFVEVVNGVKNTVRQASKRLTGVLESLQAQIIQGTPLEITYKGKQKNKTNQFMSDSWSVKPLFFEKK